MVKWLITWSLTVTVNISKNHTHIALLDFDYKLLLIITISESIYCPLLIAAQLIPYFIDEVREGQSSFSEIVLSI